MRGNERGDYQAWLDWAAYGVRAERDRKVSVQLADWKEASPGPGSSVSVADDASVERGGFVAGVVEIKVKRKKAQFAAYQKRISRAVTGKCDPGFMELDLGYTIDQLKAHLERQFSPRMSWRNYAGNLPYRSSLKHWHIDHITPKSRFASDDVVGAYALANLRPLWSQENLQKGARKTHLL